jgi:hypothetical protein
VPIDRDDVGEMPVWEDSGVSLDAAVPAVGQDRAVLERLLPYCARPLDVGFVEYCRRSQPKGRCLVLAGCGRLDS